MRKLLLFSVAAVLAFVVTPTLAAPTTDSFSIKLFGPNLFIAADGTGFNDGTGVQDIYGAATPWYYYPDTQWYNQWFYDAPARPDAMERDHLQYPHQHHCRGSLGNDRPQLEHLGLPGDWACRPPAFATIGPSGRGGMDCPCVDFQRPCQWTREY
jgi:hypothetical protein